MWRRFFFLSVLVLFSSLTALAQETPWWEIFGGYSYARVDLGPTSPVTPSPTSSFRQRFGFRYVNANGWHASAAENVSSWFGAAVEFSGHYARPTVNLARFGFPGSTAQANTWAYTFMAGPRLSFRKLGQATLFAHALFGGAHAKAEVATLNLRALDTAWSVAVGGGFDVKVSNHLALRAQGDLIRSHFADLPQNNIRVSGGLVYRVSRR